MLTDNDKVMAIAKSTNSIKIGNDWFFFPDFTVVERFRITTGSIVRVDYEQQGNRKVVSRVYNNTDNPIGYKPKTQSEQTDQPQQLQQEQPISTPKPKFVPYSNYQKKSYTAYKNPTEPTYPTQTASKSEYNASFGIRQTSYNNATQLIVGQMQIGTYKKDDDIFFHVKRLSRQIYKDLKEGNWEDGINDNDPANI